MKVILYPEKTWAEFGEVRYELSTEIVRPEAMSKDEIDIDRDIESKHWACKTEARARELAGEILRRNDLAFGAVTLQKQVVDWFVREDRVAEWSDVGEPEELTR